MNSNILRLILYLAIISIPQISFLKFADEDIKTLSNSFYITLASPYLILFILLFFDGAKHPNKIQRTIQFLMFVVMFSFAWLEFLSYYFQGRTFNDAYFYHSSPSTLKIAFDIFPILYVFPCTIILILSFVEISFARSNKLASSNLKNRYFFAKLALSILLLLILPNSTKNFSEKYSRYYSKSSNSHLVPLTTKLEKLNFDVEALPNKQSKHKITASTPPIPKNLVLIYLEGIEAAYLDQSKFPNLVPNLTSLTSKSILFSNLNQLPNTSWSIAGVFASQCGLTIGSNSVSKRNDVISDNFSQQDFTCLSDVLKKAGYYQVYMKGASIEFAGNQNFALSHQYDQTLGLMEQRSKVIPKNYLSNWGIFDDTLFDLAIKKYDELDEKIKPFNLTIFTLDTHMPNGSPSKSCPSYKANSNSMLQAVHCTDFLVGNFLNQIRTRKSFKDTVVFIMSDHLAMRNAASKYYPVGSERRLLAFAYNAQKKGEIKKFGAHFDIPHTIIDLLQIQTNAKFPLGENLLRKGNNKRFKIFETQQEGLIQDAYKILSENNHDINICGGAGISFFYEKVFQMKIKNGNFPISYGGYSDIPKEHVFLVQASKTGKYISSSVENEDEAKFLINQNLDSIYFLLKRQKEKRRIWQWYFGNPSAKVQIRGSSGSIAKIKISKKECLEIINQINNH